MLLVVYGALASSCERIYDNKLLRACHTHTEALSKAEADRDMCLKTMQNSIPCKEQYNQDVRRAELRYKQANLQ